MVTDWFDAAMRQAHDEIRPKDGSCYREISGLDGVWANAGTLDECGDELCSACEEWVLLGLQTWRSDPVR